MALREFIGVCIVGGVWILFLAYYFSIEDGTSFWKELKVIGIVIGMIAALSLGIYLISC